MNINEILLGADNDLLRTKISQTLKNLEAKDIGQDWAVAGAVDMNVYKFRIVEGEIQIRTYGYDDGIYLSGDINAINLFIKEIK